MPPPPPPPLPPGKEDEQKERDNRIIAILPPVTQAQAQAQAEAKAPEADERKSSLSPPTLKPSRSLSLIVGEHSQASKHREKNLRGAFLNNYHNPKLANDSSYFFTASQLAEAAPGATGKRPANKLGHQLHSQYSMPCSLDTRSRRATQQYNSTYQLSHSLLDERIIFCQLSIVNKKDFSEEVRALLDVRKFVADSFILTDVSEVRIDAIVESIIERLVKCRHLGHSVAEEAKNQLFVERESLSMLLANNMQGVYKSRSDGRLAYDQSWIVAICSLANLTKRQVAITRFAQPVNFGRHSQEVRFLIIVLAPSKEKLTKSAWETGRTFATMFTDIEFRRRLLRAKSEDEFKVELLVRAETLAREHELRAAEAAAAVSSDDDDDDELYDDDDDGVDLSPYYGEISAKTKSANNQVAISCCATSGSVGTNSGRMLVSKADSNSSGGSGASSAASTSEKVAVAATATPRRPNSAGVRRRARKRSLGTGSGAKRGASSGSGGGGSGSDKGKGGCCAPAGKLGAGLLDDLKRRSRWYPSDFTDGLLGERSLYKTISTTIFLYFSVLLPCIAFGVVDTNNTDGHIDPKKTMIGQALGGLFFALFSGQPLVVVMTTAPLCIYVKVIYQISQDLQVDFGSFYACVGLWMALFLIAMSLTNSSNLMKHCTRSTEDIFAIFTAFAFGSDGVREAVRSFQKYYWEPDCGLHQTQHVVVSHALLDSGASAANSSLAASNLTAAGVAAPYATSPLVDNPRHLSSAHATLLSAHQDGHLLPAATSSANSSILSVGGGGDAGALSLDHAAEGAFALASHSIIRCQRETCILFLFLMCGTLWLANSFNSFDRTPYLSSRKREIIKDYALAISVLIFSFIGSYMFSEVRLDVFEFSEFTGLHVARGLMQLSYLSLATACLLGFMGSVLFYIDQNICGAMVNNAPYKLKKGNYFHLDLFVLAILNTFLSLTGLPWMHGKLPHSHLHSKALADYEERVDEGHIHQMIVNIRETRMTGILVSLLVALSLLAVPYPLSYIPLPVLSGVFLYTALAEFKSNSMVERICLLFTEQAAYPPNHYIRRCPQRKIHLFTLAQIVQLAIVSAIGFYPNPYVNMAFPLAVATFVPVRQLFLPKLIDNKYLHSLDSPSLE